MVARGSADAAELRHWLQQFAMTPIEAGRLVPGRNRYRGFRGLT